MKPFESKKEDKMRNSLEAVDKKIACTYVSEVGCVAMPSNRNQAHVSRRKYINALPYFPREPTESGNFRGGPCIRFAFSVFNAGRMPVS
jgi:hypothetical protein